MVILLGDAANVLKDFKDESIDCVVTSPPYWALRDYKTEGQLGLETTFQEYINKLLAVFDQIKRILKKEGTCWVVLGDTYSTGVKGDNRSPESMRLSRQKDRKVLGIARQSVDSFKCRIMDGTRKIETGISDKSLCLIPERFAIGMIDRGWILRNDIIWHKPNCMPSSATDRFTVDYEHIFFFVKSQRYYFKTQYERFLSEPHPPRSKSQIPYATGSQQQGFTRNRYRPMYSECGQRIKRAVWRINTQPFNGASIMKIVTIDHFAVFPEELIKTPIVAGCPEGGTVIDPFAGSGTTLLAAHKLLRNWVGIEINKDYVALAKKRLTPYVQQQRLEQFSMESIH